MKRKFFRLLSLLAVALPFLSSCGSNKLASGDFDIEFKTIIPIAFVGESYNFNRVLVKKDGIEYSMTAKYFNYETKSMNSLSVKDFHFTPVQLGDITVVVSAYNQSVYKQRTQNIRVSIKGDPVDELLTNGESSFCDEGISKELNINPEFVKVGTSSIFAKFNHSKFYRWGAAVIAPNNFRLLDYWSDKTWDNAILTFWVFNPTDYQFEFQLRVKETPELGNLDIDWGQPLNTPQFAEPHVWTQIFFSMNKIGINRPLYINESGTVNDQFIVKTRWHGPHGTEEHPLQYTWSMYIDGVDVVDHSVYPDVPTDPITSAETLGDGWENMFLDTGETDHYGRSLTAFDRNVIRTTDYKSKSSLKLTFANTVIQDADIGYSVMFSPANQYEVDPEFSMPSFAKGTIKFDVKFSKDVTDNKISFCSVQKDETGDWENANIISGIIPEDLGDGWMRIYFDFAKVPSYANQKKPIRFGLSFPGVTETNKRTATIHIDNIFFDQYGEGPAPKKESRGKMINPNAGNIFEFDKGSGLNAANTEIIFDYKFTSGDDTYMNICIYTASDWDYYFGYFVFDKNGEVDGVKGITVTDTEDGYKHVVIKTWQLPASSTGKKPIAVNGIYVRNGGWTTATGYIDFISAKEVENPGRGYKFVAGEDLFIPFDSEVDASSAVITFDYKITSAADTQISIRIVDDPATDPELNYAFGYFDLGKDGLKDGYDGLTTTTTEDGYVRIIATCANITRTPGGLKPTKVAGIHIRGSWTNANGFMDVVSTEKGDRGTAIVPGDYTAIEFPSSFDGEKAVIVFDYKITSENTGDNNISIRITDDIKSDPELIYSYGYFDLEKDGLRESYDGLTTTITEDGYIRVTVICSQVTKTVFGNRPSTVCMIHVNGNFTKATGYIDLISVTEA